MKNFKSKKRKTQTVQIDDWLKIGGELGRVTQVRLGAMNTRLKIRFTGFEPDPFWNHPTLWDNDLELPNNMKIRIYNQK